MANIAITGAGRGIGLELARQALARGDRVIGLVRSPHAAVAALPGLETTPLDLEAPESFAPAAEALAERLGDEPLDALICNAGVLLGRERLDGAYPPEDWAKSFAVNVTGVFLSVRAFLPMLRRPGGKIGVISSAMGSSQRAPGGSYIYRASKAAATNLARNLATDLKPEGIAVAAWHPGWVRTDMGGQEADIDAAQSAAGLLARLDALGPETSGVFESYAGEPVAF